MRKVKTQFTIDDFEGLSDRKLACIADIYDGGSDFIKEWEKDENWFEDKVKKDLEDLIYEAPLDAKEVSKINAILGRDAKTICRVEILNLQTELSTLDEAIRSVDDGVDDALKAVKKAYKQFKKAVKANDLTYI